MTSTKEMLSSAKYILPADACGEPQRVGQRAARFDTEVLIDELLERGYSKSAIIEGLKEAVSNAETAASSAEN